MKNLVNSGTNHEYTKSHNLQVVLQAIRQNSNISRPELCEMTGLTAQTVSKISQALMANGLVEISGRRSSGRGYPAPEFRVRPNGGYALGVNVDQDHITIILVDFSGAIRGRVHYNVRFPSLEYALPIVAKAVDDLLDQIPKSRLRTYGVGLAVPGRISMEGELIHPPRSLMSWKNQPLRKMFSNATKLPVWVENNANSAAIGESYYGVGHKHRNFFHMFLGTGVGCGIIINGQLYKGASGFAGEIGLYPMNPLGPEGGDENFENLSDHISFYGVFQNLEAKNEIGAEIKTVEDLVASNHPAIEDWLKDTTKALLAPVSVVQSLLDPEVFVFGGGVPATLMERLVTKLDKAVSKWSEGKLVPPKFISATTGRDGTALGAATLPFYYALSVSPEGLLKNSGPPKKLSVSANSA